MTVLIVDDNPLVRSGIQALLGQLYGTVAVTAAEPHEAMEVFTALKPDIAILDFDLGAELTGADLSVWMREQSPSIRIGLMSGTSGPFPRLEDVGVDFFVSKPFGPEELVRVVFPSLTGSDDIFVLNGRVWEREGGEPD